ncbi:MAG: class I SAM-dependent methyltransferase [Paludibacteraceae bacterium]|nr:class I SAM-dependent methyltransferase [Paludibacteraceae bacterium]
MANKIHLDTCPVCGTGHFRPFLTCTDHTVSNEQFTLHKCEVCEFIATQDFPSENEIGKYYISENYISHSDNKKGLFNRLYHVARHRMLRHKIKLIDLLSTRGKLLDIGCGTGYFLNEAQIDGWDVVGIEKSEQARQFTHDNFHIETLPSESLFSDLGKFDIISMWHVLEHIESFNATLTRIKELLNDKGFAIIALPNCNSTDAKFYKSNWAAYDVPRHLWHFTPNSFKQVANQNGFAIIDTFRMPLDSFYVSVLSAKYKKSIFPMIEGFLIGFYSYIVSLFSKNKCSSIIYILKKEKNEK